MFLSARKPERPPSVPERFMSRSEKKSAKKTNAIKIRDRVLNKENRLVKCTKNLFPEENCLLPKRESLGLLPEYNLEDIDLSTFDIMQEIDTNTQIIKKTMSIQEDINMKPLPSVQDLEKICKDPIICDKLTKLLHEHNRQLIWNLFQNLEEDSHVSIVKNLVFDHRNKV